MVQSNAAYKAFSYIVKDLVLDIFYWPIWWYTTGLMEALFRFADTVRGGNDELALTIWMKNIFVPMYGDASWEGRLISILMRLVQIIIRSLLFVLWILYAFMVLIFWLSFPLFVIYEIFFNLKILA